MGERIRTAVIGCGKFGGFHAAKHAALPNADLVAVVDTDSAAAARLAATHKTRALGDYRALVGKVDAVSVTVPTGFHFEIVQEFLAAGADVLVEKPIAATMDEAQALVALAGENDRILQVGHLERFSRVTQALEARIDEPFFIDAIRANPFHVRGTDVSVVLDLMIHDLDLALWFAGSPIAEVAASGRIEKSAKFDFAEARLTFDNGCVARLVASRVHPETERRMRVYQPCGVLDADFYRKTLTWQPATGTGAEEIALPADDDPVMAEIQSFLNCVQTRTAPKVSGEDGLCALEAALAVDRAIGAAKKTGVDAIADVNSGKNNGAGCDRSKESIECV